MDIDIDVTNPEYPTKLKWAVVTRTSQENPTREFSVSLTSQLLKNGSLWSRDVPDYPSVKIFRHQSLYRSL